MRLVRAGRRRDGAVEILAGLAAGDRVVVSADGELIDGRPISATGRP
jgi:multidrug efflux pump subunit AcrA (membrane-fusion protein)